MTTTAGPGPVAVLVLAAGAALRMGQPKQFLSFAGQTLLARAVHTALTAAVGPVLSVLGAHLAQARAALAGLPLTIVENPDWQAGLGGSIAAGVAALPAVSATAPLSGLIIHLCDQPLVTPGLLQALVARAQAGSSTIVATAAGADPAASPADFGPPVYFAAAHFPELRALRGDQGARSVIHRHTAAAGFIVDPAALLDIDTPAQFAELLARVAPP